MKKARRETQTTARQKYSPRRRPLPGGAGPPKFNQSALEMVTTCTYRPCSLVKIDARNFRVVVVTDTARPPQTPSARCKYRPPIPSARHKHTHRQDRLQYTAPLASAQCNKPAKQCRSFNPSWSNKMCF